MSLEQGLRNWVVKIDAYCGNAEHSGSEQCDFSQLTAIRPGDPIHHAAVDVQRSLRNLGHRSKLPPNMLRMWRKLLKGSRLLKRRDGDDRREKGEAVYETACDLSEIVEAWADEISQRDRPMLGTPQAAHADDYRSVRWRGTMYQFTALQAACVAALWNHWERGTPEVGQQTILETTESNQQRLSGVFDNGRHPAWGTMIVKGATKGCFRIAG